ncbi:hypothetical protein BC826DRAFT_1025502 [Russula brevipes]|nr:hypothetical protein BC826DRAFT_1025502 [Russula brevipes]
MFLNIRNFPTRPGQQVLQQTIASICRSLLECRADLRLNAEGRSLVTLLCSWLQSRGRTERRKDAMTPTGITQTIQAEAELHYMVRHSMAHIV